MGIFPTGAANPALSHSAISDARLPATGITGLTRLTTPSVWLLSHRT